ncbi:MAG TPA: hypothetical protein VIR78_13265 [Malonomonas sp.]
MGRMLLLWIAVSLVASGCVQKVGFNPEYKPLDEKVAGPCQIGEDHDGDGRVDSRVDFTYAKDGTLQTRTYYRGNDDNVAEKTVYSYVDGRLQQQTTDRGNDGSIEETERYSYDQTGTATVTVNGAAGKMIEYDAQGRMARETFDRDHDGNCDRIVSYRYNSAGLLIEENRDSDCDGQADRRISYARGADGRIIEETMIAVATNQLFATLNYRYLGNTLVKEKKDKGQTYEIVEEKYDAHGNLLSENYLNSEKKLTRKKIYSYPCWNSFF